MADIYGAGFADADRPPRPDEPCRRAACRRPGATWWNRSTRAYYCGECARGINKGAQGLCEEWSEPSPAPESAERQGAPDPRLFVAARTDEIVNASLQAHRHGMPLVDALTAAVLHLAEWRRLWSPEATRAVMMQPPPMIVVAASPPPVAAAKERDPDSLPPDGYFNYDEPAPAAPLPAPTGEKKNDSIG